MTHADPNPPKTDGPPAGGLLPLLRRMRPVVVALVLAGLFGLTGVMSVDVLRQMHTLRTAASDNLQWTLAQVDTEFLRFRLAVDRGRISQSRGERLDDDVAEVRKRFDIFYSRMDTFRSTGTYAILRETPDFVRDFGQTSAALEQIGDVIERLDPQHAALLDDLTRRGDALAPTVRRLSLTGLNEFALASDKTRGEVTTTLGRLAFTVAAMFVIVSLLAVSLLRLYRLSERRRREQMLTAARMQTVIDTSLDGIVVCDRAARILDFSPAAEAIFGYDAAEVRGRDMLALILPPARDRATAAGDADLETVLHSPAAGTPRRVRLDCRNRQGRVFPAEVSVQLVEGQVGQILVLFIRDISQMIRAETELQSAHDRAVAGEKAKAEFVAVMSHEMRTPLNGLLGTMSLLKDTQLDARQRRYVENMQVSGGPLSALVNDVLDLSKLEAGMMRLQPRPFRLSRVVGDVVENQMHLARANGNTLSWAWDGDAFEPTIGDPARIRQVLLNFVNNAIKFTHDGEIRIELEALGPAAARREVEIRVIDTGVGIEAVNLDRVFDDFEMVDSSYARQAGTGLGLGISRRLVEVMGGEIGVESEPGVGSLFWMRLPLEAAHGAEAKAAAEGGVALAARPEQPLSVLIVEDNEINRTILREMVEAEGHRVDEAADGRQGVEKAGQRAYDVILMDVSMPVMDGREATRAIRSGTGASREVAIVGVTAHALPEELGAFHAAGMNEVLKKPIDRAQLIGLMTRLSVSRARGADKAPRLFDPERLAELGAGPTSPQIRSLLARFVAQLDELQATLQAGSDLPPDEADALRLQALHRCAGSAGTFGAEALLARLLAIESASRRGDRAPLAAAAEGLGPLLAQTRAAVQAWLDQPA